MLSRRLLGDADIGWHIRNGQQIARTHILPRTDSFSSTMAGKPWYAWEWLYDWGIGFVHHRAGLNGVVFLTALVIALTFTLLFRMQLLRSVNLLVAVVLLLLAASASTIHFLARPHVSLPSACPDRTPVIMLPGALRRIRRPRPRPARPGTARGARS